MKSVTKVYLAVSGGILIIGIVLAALGFALSGFDLSIFTTTVDISSDTVILGGRQVDESVGLPLLNQLREAGNVSLSIPDAPMAPNAP